MGERRTTTLDPDGITTWLASAFRLNDWKGLVAGVGQDDCGVIRLGSRFAVLSVDFLNATPIAEQLGLGGERVLGRLAVAATIADLLGSGAVPRAILVAVTVPHDYPEHRFKHIMLGAKLESKRWHAPIIAGDTKLGHGRAVLTCGIGTVDSSRELFLASRAKPGDLIFASGNLGTCAAATYTAPKRERVPEWVRRAITVPNLPMARSRSLAKLHIAHGGIDISDGLASDLRRMCDVSGVGAILEVDRIPVDSRVRAVAKNEGVAPWAFSLASGGDFQFIVTVPPKARAVTERLGFVRIGLVTRERQFSISEAGGKRSYKLPKVGHRDRRGQRFADEVRQIIARIKS